MFVNSRKEHYCLIMFNCPRINHGEEDIDAPSGHHSLNCTYGDENGDISVDRLKEIAWHRIVIGILLMIKSLWKRRRKIKRSIVGDEGYEDEAFEEKVFPCDL
jgi:hypothetical protein